MIFYVNIFATYVFKLYMILRPELHTIQSYTALGHKAPVLTILLLNLLSRPLLFNALGIIIFFTNHFFVLRCVYRTMTERDGSPLSRTLWRGRRMPRSGRFPYDLIMMVIIIKMFVSRANNSIKNDYLLIAKQKR